MTLSPTEQVFAWWQMFVKELCFKDKSAILKAEWDFKKVKKGKVTLFNVGSSFSNETGISGSRRYALYPPASVSAPFYGYSKLWLHGSEESRSRR